jgi:hypothetical protein
MKRLHRISQSVAAVIFDKLKPLWSRVDWIDMSAPLNDTRISAEQIQNANLATKQLLSRSNFTVKSLLDILLVIAPRKVRKKQEREVVSSNKTHGLQEQYRAFENMVTAKRAERQQRKSAKPAEKKKASGFRSRVGSLLRKRKKRGRSAKKGKPRKPRKPRQKKVKKVEVEKQEPVMEPKKPVEIPASPRIKQKKSRGDT